MESERQRNEAFFALLRGGLWEQDVWLELYGKPDFGELMRLGEEQSVLGLLAAGLEHVKDGPVPKQDAIPFLQRVLTVENRNSAMNAFVASLFEQLQAAGISAVLVKGQGIAQCYARPQWRAPGDLDLLLSAGDYEKAKDLLVPGAESVDKEYPARKHLALTLEGWTVELHGSLRSLLSHRLNVLLDEVQADMFARRDFRYWHNGGCEVPLPGPDSDVIFVFCHILQHFFFGGIGLRQICDWCRLLWTYRDSINPGVLMLRLRQMGLLSEWKVFAAFAVDYLGMPRSAIPFCSAALRWKRKARRIEKFVLEVGNFGHNRDLGDLSGKPYLVRKLRRFVLRLGDAFRHLPLFPLDALKFSVHIILTGLHAAARGE